MLKKTHKIFCEIVARLYDRVERRVGWPCRAVGRIWSACTQAACATRRTASFARCGELCWRVCASPINIVTSTEFRVLCVCARVLLALLQWHKEHPSFDAAAYKAHLAAIGYTPSGESETQARTANVDREVANVAGEQCAQLSRCDSAIALLVGSLFARVVLAEWSLSHLSIYCLRCLLQDRNWWCRLTTHATR